MKKLPRHITRCYDARLGFVFTPTVALWFKTSNWTYTVDFNLDIQGFIRFSRSDQPDSTQPLIHRSRFYIKKTNSLFAIFLASMSHLFIWLISTRFIIIEFTDS